MIFDFVLCTYATACLKKNRRKAGGVSCFRFQYEYDKVKIALRDVQFWSKIELVITNRTPSARFVRQYSDVNGSSLK